MKKTYSRILAFLLALVMVFALAACGNSDQPKPDAPQPGGVPEVPATTVATKKTADDTLVYAFAFSGSEFDPTNVVSDWITTIWMTYETLVRYDVNAGELRGVLADKFEVVDTQTIKFHIRDGATFSNGDPVTGEDVLFSWKRCDTSMQFSSMSKQIDWANCVVDGQDLTIKLLAPNADFIYFTTLSGFAIVSKNYVESVGESEFKLKPMGSGPYTLGEFTPGESITYVRNDNYWGGKAKYGTVVIKPILEEATRSISFEAGEVDIARITTADSIATLVGRESEGIYVAPSAGSTVYYMNLWDQSEIFDDANLRLAVAHAVDWKAVVQSLWGDYATTMDTALSSASPYATSMGGYEYSPEKAKEYMAAGGYPDGFTFGIAVGTSGNDVVVAEMIQGYLKEVGITLKVNTMDNALARAASADGSHEISLGQNNRTVPALACVWAGQAAGSNSLLQEVHTDYAEGAKFQELMVSISSELDAAKKEALTKEIQKLVHDECLWIPIAQVGNVWVYYDYIAEDAVEMVTNGGFDQGLDIRDLFF